MHHHFFVKDDCTSMWLWYWSVRFIQYVSTCKPVSLSSFNEHTMYTFYASYESWIQSYIGFGYPWFLKHLKRIRLKFAFFIIIYKKEIVNFILLLLWASFLYTTLCLNNMNHFNFYYLFWETVGMNQELLIQKVFSFTPPLARWSNSALWTCVLSQQK